LGTKLFSQGCEIVTNPTETSAKTGNLARFIAIVVQFACKMPRTVLVLSFVTVAVSVCLSFLTLKYQTQRNDLISAEKECQQRWQRYLDLFGDDDDLIVVIRGGERAKMIAAADTVAAKLSEYPQLFDRVFHRVDLRNLYPRSLYFLPEEQLRLVQQRLDGMDPLLGPFGQLAWQTLSFQALLTQANLIKKAGSPSQQDRDLLAMIPQLIASATLTVKNPENYRNPWTLVGSRDDSVQLQEPQHFLTPDGRLCMVLARPVKDAESFTPVRRACQTARSILAEVRKLHPDVELGLTGLPVLETDEMAASEEDSTFASWLALVGVAGLYFVVYRGVRYPLLTVGTLLIGSCWAIGFATLTIGHLNILSATFAVMIIGMGDYGVLWIARYDEERRFGRDVRDALEETAIHTGPSIVTAAITTSLAFFATMLADFQAVAELGWIAGWGVLFCGIACITFLPAMIVVIDTYTKPVEEDQPKPIPIDAGRAFLPWIASKPQLVLAAGLVAIVVCGLFGQTVRYDSNLLHMQADGLDSVMWEKELIRHAAGATWDAMSIATNRTEALEFRKKYEQLPDVGRVIEAASLIPDNQQAKTPLVAAIHAKLGKLPSTAPSPAARDCEEVTKLLAEWGRAPTEELRELLSTPHAADRLQFFDTKLRSDLLADLQQLRAVSHPTIITLDDLPANFRERYIGKNGEFLVRAFASKSLWELSALEEFTISAASVDSNSTGKSFRTLEGLRQMRTGFERAGLLALGVIIAVLWLDFRRLRSVILGLFPLLVGVVATLGVMGLAGVPLNPANLIALPLIVGVGVDNGVHVLHDYNDKLPGKLYRLSASTGRGIAVAAMTTILGFGTLILARHRGMASLGFVLTIGVTFCMLAALVLLPAWLRWIDIRALRNAPTGKRESNEKKGRRAG
jgi:uncharacterized protein